LPAATPIAMHVQMAYPHGDPPYDKTLTMPRGDTNERVIEFDVPRGLYHVWVDVPKYNCSSSTFEQVLADRNRKMVATLADSSVRPEQPILLLQGDAPISFAYLKPTYVLFDSSLTCNQPISAPLPTHIDIDYDQGAYYLKMYAEPSLQLTNPVFALRLRTPTGLAHYMRLPIKLPPAEGGWPSVVQFNIADDAVADYATQKTDTLLCPKVWGTSAG